MSATCVNCDYNIDAETWLAYHGNTVTWDKYMFNRTYTYDTSCQGIFPLVTFTCGGFLYIWHTLKARSRSLWIATRMSWKKFTLFVCVSVEHLAWRSSLLGGSNSSGQAWWWQTCPPTAPSYWPDWRSVFNYKPAVAVYSPSSWKGKDGSELSKTLSERKLSFYNVWTCHSRDLLNSTVQLLAFTLYSKAGIINSLDMI